MRNTYAHALVALHERSYKGEGFWSAGRRIISEEFTQDRPLALSEMPTHLCGGTYRSRTHRRQRRKGPQLREKPTYAERKKRRVERKFGVAGEGRKIGADADAVAGGNGGCGPKPRVAKSKRGRELRAAAALKRFGEGKKESEEAKVGKDEGGDGDGGEEGEEDWGHNGDETASESDNEKVVNVGGGKFMVPVSAEGDVNRGSEDMNREMLELMGGLCDRTVSGGQPPPSQTRVPTTLEQSLSSSPSPPYPSAKRLKAILPKPAKPTPAKPLATILPAPGIPILPKPSKPALVASPSPAKPRLSVEPTKAPSAISAVAPKPAKPILPKPANPPISILPEPATSPFAIPPRPANPVQPGSGRAPPKILPKPANPPPPPIAEAKPASSATATTATRGAASHSQTLPTLAPAPQRRALLPPTATAVTTATKAIVVTATVTATKTAPPTAPLGSGSGVQQQQPPPQTCPVCSFANLPHAPACGACMNVLAFSTGAWACATASCPRQYRNSSDVVFCGVCGVRRH